MRGSKLARRLCVLRSIGSPCPIRSKKWEQSAVWGFSAAYLCVELMHIGLPCGIPCIQWVLPTAYGLKPSHSKTVTYKVLPASSQATRPQADCAPGAIWQHTLHMRQPGASVRAGHKRGVSAAYMGELKKLRMETYR